MIRRGSGDASADRRRASLGAGLPGSFGRSGESIFDPSHAAILFRDSRGVRLTFFLKVFLFTQNFLP